MLDTIGDSAIRMATKIDNNAISGDKDVDVAQTDRVVEERPVEQSSEGTSAGFEKSEGDGTTNYNLSEGGIVFEKYDKDGNMILRIPPNEKPIDEIV